ncbi:hypothetical protein [Amphibacillus jilinensis]|uniref:hypothetical protein n=1 Tax=Amphibacillus jilinensis TaxID=1216008 RepID=UPI00030F0B6F|nr:hypothetical protein [Amphibacillus jilinensis]
MITKCDSCNHEFELTQLTTESFELLPNNVERHYFECPNCNKQYTTHYLNDDLKEMQEEIRRLQNKHPLKIKQKNKLAKLKRKIIFLHNQLKMEVEHK